MSLRLHILSLFPLKRFSYVPKIYGASNVARILQDLPVNRRAEAADSLFYKAHCRGKDPVYGCVGIVTILHQEIHKVQFQLARVQAEIGAALASETQNSAVNSASSCHLSAWFY